MSKLFLRPVLLDRERHRHQRVRAQTDFGFAAHVHAVHLAAVEFREACKEYPVVFATGADGLPEPVAVLGLRTDANVFVDAQGQWDARYVPASVRRHPFVLAQLPGQASLGVCLDEASPRVGEQEGEALFDAQGAQTPYLRQAIGFLEQFQLEHRRTRVFCRRLQEAGVLQAMNARAELADGAVLQLDGLLVVDEERLRALPESQVMPMFRAGELDLVGMHLMSLSNLQRLVERTARAA